MDRIRTLHCHRRRSYRSYNVGCWTDYAGSFIDPNRNQLPNHDGSNASRRYGLDADAFVHMEYIGCQPNVIPFNSSFRGRANSSIS